MHKKINKIKLLAILIVLNLIFGLIFTLIQKTKADDRLNNLAEEIKQENIIIEKECQERKESNHCKTLAGMTSIEITRETFIRDCKTCSLKKINPIFKKNLISIKNENITKLYINNLFVGSYIIYPIILLLPLLIFITVLIYLPNWLIKKIKMRSIKKYIIDIIIISGLIIFSYNSIVRPSYNFIEFISDERYVGKILGILLISIGIDIAIRKYINHKNN